MNEPLSWPSETRRMSATLHWPDKANSLEYHFKQWGQEWMINPFMNNTEIGQKLSLARQD